MKIIVPLRPASVSELEMLLNQLDNRADIIEVWLDHLIQELMLAPNLVSHTQNLLQTAKQKYDVELLGVCKTPAEQGSFPGSSKQRVQALQQWLELGGDWVDLDVTQNEPELIVQMPKAQLWLSFHDFTWADPTIIKLRYQTMQKFDPTVYKFAVTPETEADLEHFLKFAESVDKPTIFTTMGPLGAQGREQLKDQTWGAFYALSPEHATASGQPSLADLPKS